MWEEASQGSINDNNNIDSNNINNCTRHGWHTRVRCAVYRTAERSISHGAATYWPAEITNRRFPGTEKSRISGNCFDCRATDARRGRSEHHAIDCQHKSLERRTFEGKLPDVHTGSNILPPWKEQHHWLVELDPVLLDWRIWCWHNSKSSRIPRTENHGFRKRSTEKDKIHRYLLEIILLTNTNRHNITDK